ncbi:MAG: porin family protein [Gelidibacter sp.]
MKLRILFICFILASINTVAQQTIDTTNVDLRYREDQFYIGVTYNLIGKKPKDVSQSGFSSGFHFGFIRDMPINEKRNVAIGLGLGLSSNSYNQNMLIEPDTNGYHYSVIDESIESIKKNKFTTYLVEAPLEFRWRTSTAKDYKFWRIYTGFKVGYVFYSSSKYRGSLGTIKNSNLSDINKLQYGLTFSAGYSTWNFHVYYGLNPLFKNSAQINGEAVKMNSIKIGLMFYIL